MKQIDKKLRGISGSIWPLATLRVFDNHLTLHKSGSKTTKSYKDIKYITVSWLGSIRFYFDNNGQSESNFWFLSMRTPELLMILTDRHVVAGGHVARRLLVSRILIGALYSALYLLIVVNPLSVFPWSPSDSGLITNQDIVFIIVFTFCFPIASVWGYFTGNYGAQADQYQDEDWFPWD